MNLEYLTAEKRFTPLKSLDVRGGINGNLSAMCYVQGRMAQKQGKCIFDCPFEINSDKAELWMDGFIYEENKVRRGEV